MKVRPKLWFRSRQYGHGWFPATPEGWLVLIVWFLIFVGSTIVTLVAQIKAPGIWKTALFVLWALVAIADSLALLYIADIKGEKSHWRLKLRRKK